MRAYVRLLQRRVDTGMLCALLLCETVLLELLSFCDENGARGGVRFTALPAPSLSPSPHWPWIITLLQLSSLLCFHRITHPDHARSSGSMSCVIREVDDEAYDPDVLERQLGLALVREHEGDPQKLLASVLGFLKRRSNFFRHGDPQKRLLEAYRAVAGDAEPAAAAAASAGGAAGAAAPAPGAVPASVTGPATPAVAAAAAAASQVRRAGGRAGRTWARTAMGPCRALQIGVWGPRRKTPLLHAHTLTRTHTRTRARTHTHTRTHTHARARAHTHACPCIGRSRPSLATTPPLASRRRPRAPRSRRAHSRRGRRWPSLPAARRPPRHPARRPPRARARTLTLRRPPPGRPRRRRRRTWLAGAWRWTRARRPRPTNPRA
jgi:hypothetical protein